MPSSNKTPHLQLNKWNGSDKPKKDDFNSDNQKIDEACRLLEQSVALLESAMKSADSANEKSISTLSTTVASHTSSISSMSSSISSASSSLTSHTGNSGIHVTQAEKNAWTNNSGAILGSYTGNGNSTQKITLGFAPLFVFVFPVDDGLGRVNWTGQMYAGNAGCASSLGSTYGITRNTDGFTVEYRNPGGIDGYQIKHNAPSVKYVYLAFKA